MLSYLNEEQRRQYDNAIKARESQGRELTVEEQLILKMLRHDWTHEYSDDASVARHGREAERQLKALIAEADLDPAARERLERYFRMGSASAETELHREFGWLFYRDGYTPRGKVAMALAGQYSDVQWGEFERVFSELTALGQRLKAAKSCDRLLMTDDIPPFTVLTMLAKRVREEEGNPFYYGIAIPADCQEELDRIVRTEKRTLVLMAQDKRVLEAFNHGCEVITDLHQDHWLFKIQFSGAYYDSFGFFCCPHVTRPRSEWNKKSREGQNRPHGKRPMEPREMSHERRERTERLRHGRDPEVGRVINESRRHTSDAPRIDDVAYAPRAARVTPPPQVKRKIVPALSNRPLVVADNVPAKKKEKTAPKARAKKFTTVGSLADLAAALNEQ